MSDTYITIGSTGQKKRIIDLGDGIYADAVVAVNGGAITTEQVLAKAADSTDGLGKIATIANAATVYVRCDTNDIGYGRVDWRIQADQKHDLQFYKARSIVDSVTLTLSGFTEADTIVINGITYTGESTANTADYASRKFSTAGGTDTLDAAELAKVINADYAVVTAGTSVAATDKLTITTDEGAHVIEAAAEADYPNGKYGLDATAATEAASIVLAINHKDNVTLASVTAGDTVTINGTVFTAHATTTTASKREFAISGDNDADAAELVKCVNDNTYGVSGVTASAAGAVVSFARDSLADTVTLTSSNATRLKTEAAGGVPGVIAAASPVSAEISITPVWTAVLTVTKAGDQLTVTDIDCPGILATASEGVVTLTPGTPGAPSGQDLAHFIQATASAHCTVAQTATLAGLMIDGDAVADVAANNTTAGRIYSQEVQGYEYCYAGITNDSGSSAATVVVGATLRA